MLRRIIHRQRIFQDRKEPSIKESVIDEFDSNSDDYDDEGEEFEEEDEEFETKVWETLRHQGPWFESYDRELSREEILVLYSRVPERYYNRTFWKNFLDWFGPTKKDVRALLASIRKKNPPGQPRKEDVKMKHDSCTIKIEGGESVTERITNWRMEPPVIFLGRGDHPLRGCLRRRVVPEDVTLNLDSEAPIPKLPRGRRWKEVVHRPECGWLWSWTDPLLGKIKYVYPSAISKGHSERERQKFDEAMQLETFIGKIRKFYNQSFERGEYLELACVLYLIDNLGIRIGTDNNDKVLGATTLKVENIQVVDGKRMIRIRFIGKDSIEYDNQLACDPGFVQAIKTLSKGRGSKDPIFPNVNPRIVNSYLQSYHPGLKAKAFRTFNATRRFSQSIQRFRKGGSQQEAIAWFKKCVMEVAVFCNHKRISTLKKRSIERHQEQYSPSTSITNYIDPRVVVEWAQNHEIPLERLYSKTLLQRFSWAIKE